ncbi:MULTISPECIES: flagellar basal body rod protein FlgG [Aneurinibacillus]|jgi:flagellar hook protein FlgE|uniref:Flagellar hook protein FlgE n=1 Tax=Aneurinibacillus danicus TaxID=267746 RepID=A0A511V871_9BACL|nr:MULTISPECIES: flagellar basal body rod protein FlgG [Aneurinibacillus]GEN34098.1 flagellar basal-body rod protein FlgG [Aneurinibacillus danicus]
MLRSMYSGIGGMRGFQTKLDVIGNNIANVNTVGFKKSRVMFQDILSQTVAGGSAANVGGTPPTGGINPKQIGLGSTMSAIDVVHTQGAPMTTNLPSDVAIEGNGFFVVGTSTTDFLFTRAGNFTVDAEGYLVTSQGKYVLSASGEKINLLADIGGGTPPDDKIKSYSIGQDGTITVSVQKADGTTTTASSSDDSTKIGVAYITNPGGLEKVGGSLYKWAPAADATNVFDDLVGLPGTSGRGLLMAGQLEMSNVDLAEEFTEMIVAQRGFQANSRIITTSDSILEELVNLKR